ncbi:hypothetical protein I310019A7_38690 [Lawsonibacter asaccharolyticus]
MASIIALNQFRNYCHYYNNTKLAQYFCYLAFSAVPTYFKSNLLYNNQRKKSQKQCEKNILVLQVKRESSLSY